MKSLAIHHEREPFPDTRTPDPHQDVFSKTVVGFWMYLMTDCLLFGSLFATFGVLHNSTFGGPPARELFQLSTAFIETMVLLLSSVTCGLAVLASLKGSKSGILGWLALTFLLGTAFIAIELHEFAHLVETGNSWTRSAFLSSYFTLVGTHGFHVSVGLLWLFIMMLQVHFLGLTVDTFRRLVLFSMFWHFLDLVWIFIFTFVYLLEMV